ncbi:hypothetical protein LCGC14_2346330, partial [marine sediment metagenome]
FIYGQHQYEHGPGRLARAEGKFFMGVGLALAAIPLLMAFGKILAPAAKAYPLAAAVAKVGATGLFVYYLASRGVALYDTIQEPDKDFVDVLDRFGFEAGLLVGMAVGMAVARPLTRLVRHVGRRGARVAAGRSSPRRMEAFLVREGITDPALRRLIIEGGLTKAIGKNTPITLQRFRKLFPETIARGKRFLGRLGNVQTRAVTIREAQAIELQGLIPRFEYSAGGRFADIVAVRGYNPVRVIQVVKQLRSGAIAPPEIPAALDLEGALSIPVEFVIGGFR